MQNKAIFKVDDRICQSWQDLVHCPSASALAHVVAECWLQQRLLIRIHLSIPATSWLYIGVSQLYLFLYELQGLQLKTPDRVPRISFVLISQMTLLAEVSCIILDRQHERKLIHSIHQFEGNRDRRQQHSGWTERYAETPPMSGAIWEPLQYHRVLVSTSNTIQLR